ncbi:MAG: acyl-CoA dehydrogenase family protein [Acidimicrobiales bacterium]
MDGADLELFERSLRHATEQHTGAALDAALDELGWPDALEIDPRAAVSLLFELQGAANVTSSALDRLLLGAIGTEHVTSGPTIPGLVLPALGRSTPPGAVAADRLTIASGLGTAALATRETAVVVARTDGKDVAVVVPTAELALRPVVGLDPALGLVEVSGESIAITAAPQAVTGWTAAVALAQVAIGHELVGASRKMLDLARQHALERIQFGQPISMFQAVRHRLADALVAIETADAVLDAAWLDQSPQTAAMAKALAGRGARTTARHCQQVLAGIGFTTEHPLHLFIRRVIVLDELLGASRTLTAQLGADLLATRQLPGLLPL